jgi:putative hydrolase of HD superfamily
VEIRELLDFLHIAENLKCNTRHSYTSSGRHESVAEHSWRLALMAFMVKDEFPETDVDKVIRMCIFHDIGEAITGDIPAFDKTPQDEKKENSVVSKLLESLPEGYRKELNALFEEMEEQKTTEAKLYKALDKLEAVIQHNEADISTWLPLEYDLQMTYGTKECSFSEYINELRNVVREDSRQKASGKKL